jgi:transcription antitermination factor NusG
MTEFVEEVRHRCRHQRCRMKLPAPVSNPREAFCCRGCYGSFYLRRCLVCEGAIERTTANRKICKKPKCRNALAAGVGFGRYHAISAKTTHASRNLELTRAQDEKPYWPRYRGPQHFRRPASGWLWRGIIPGYLFLPMENGKPIDCAKIEACPGVRCFLRTAEGLAVLTLADMQRIREMEEEALNGSPVAAGIPFKVGQRVRIIGNPAWEGPITRIDNKRRIVVEILMFGRPTYLTVSANKLEVVTRAAA